MGLKAGDPVNVIIRGDGTLLISTRPALEGFSSREAVIKVSEVDSPASVARRVVSTYLLGCGTIRVVGKGGPIPVQHRQAVKRLVRQNLVGTEVVMESADKLVIQVLLSLPELTVEQALRRMVLIATSMLRDAVEALRLKSRDVAESVILTDDEVDRFAIYTIRQLKLAVQNPHFLEEVGLATPRDCLGYRLVVKSVERVADHAVRIAKNVLSLDQPLPKRLVEGLRELCEFALEIFDAATSALFRRNYVAADLAIERAEGIERLETKILEELKPPLPEQQVGALRLIVESLRRVVEYSTDIAEIGLNLTADEIFCQPSATTA